MFAQSTHKFSANKLFAFAAVLMLLVLLAMVESASSQTTASKFKPAEKSSQTLQIPAWQGYKGVTIGMPAADAKAKLGNPTSEDKEGFFYAFTDNETMQVILDSTQKVRLITVMFSNGNPNAPAFEKVFTKDVVAEPKADGSIYKMVRYTEAGYWVSYSRLAGDNPLITVTIQKL